MFARLVIGLARAHAGGLEADPGRPGARHARRARGGAGRPARAATTAGPGATTAAPRRGRARRSGSAGWRRPTRCSTRSCSRWSPSTASWRSSRTGSRNLLGGFFFMGSFLGAHMLLALMMIYGASHLGVTRPGVAQAAPRSRQALLRLHRVLDLPHVGPVPGDLVRQPAGGDRLRLRAALGPLAAGGQGGVHRDVHHPVLRAARRGARRRSG